MTIEASTVVTPAKVCPIGNLTASTHFEVPGAKRTSEHRSGLTGPADLQKLSSECPTYRRA